MAAISFYHLTTTPLERALPQLLEKILLGGHKVLVTCESEERMRQLSQLLWTYRPDSFLPHGNSNEPKQEQQPILLSTDTKPLNGANMLLATDGRIFQDTEQFERVLDIFNGNDDDAVEKARGRWTKYKELGYTLTYLRQTDTGGWEHKGEKNQ